MQSLDLFILHSKPIRESDHVWEEQFGHVLIEEFSNALYWLLGGL
jgi:hypothetical protein